MDNCWIELSFPVPAGEIDQVSDLLHGLGCIGVNVEERQLDTFVVPAPDDDIPDSFLVKAYFEGGHPVDRLKTEIATTLKPSLPEFSAGLISAKMVFQEDWAGRGVEAAFFNASLRAAPGCQADLGGAGAWRCTCSCHHRSGDGFWHRQS
ncbi:MAG: hypothetical protein GWN10_11315 [Nitrospinaceae bacterium]|nr:hypothetical protein [Nitrospinaceae bacterium]NIR55229.1 hypothetical protein [Nitrospinaceae bacterium]NIX34870.1 hypothetical protein [Nitrospinaceae bacterium]